MVPGTTKLTAELINDLINAHNQCLLSNKLPLYAAKIVLIDLTDAPYENYSIILGISKKDQNHIIIDHSVSFLIDKALHILSCLMLSLKEGQTDDGNTVTLSKNSDVNVDGFGRAIWISRQQIADCKF